MIVLTILFLLFANQAWHLRKKLDTPAKVEAVKEAIDEADGTPIVDVLIRLGIAGAFLISFVLVGISLLLA